MAISTIIRPSVFYTIIAPSIQNEADAKKVLDMLSNAINSIDQILEMLYFRVEGKSAYHNARELSIERKALTEYVDIILSTWYPQS